MYTVLVVDDLALNRELIEAFLDGSEYRLLQADSGERALEIAARETLDLVLLDVMMPGIDGFETTRRLKEIAGEQFLPIILLTSLNDAHSRLRGLEMGADEFLTKPVERQELMVRVRNLLALRAKDRMLSERNVTLGELIRFKDEMSSLIVHDLKSPTTAVLFAFDELANSLGASDPSVRETLDQARCAGSRVLRLLANLLDLARAESGRLDLRRKHTSVAALINDVLGPRRPQARSQSIALQADIDTVLAVDVDTDLLSRTFENIVDNALRYTPKQGRIEVTAVAEEDGVRIEFGNTGPPLPDWARGVVFEKFGQASPSVGRMNLGLGLYFCRLAIEAHGGMIAVKSTESLPTVFVIWLPGPRGESGEPSGPVRE